VNSVATTSLCLSVYLGTPLPSLSLSFTSPMTVCPWKPSTIFGSPTSSDLHHTFHPLKFRSPHSPTLHLESMILLCMSLLPIHCSALPFLLLWLFLQYLLTSKAAKFHDCSFSFFLHWIMYFRLNFSVKRNVAIVALIIIFSNVHNLFDLFIYCVLDWWLTLHRWKRWWTVHFGFKSRFQSGVRFRG